ncbi:MAG: VTT domain-containing protein [Chloroflexota bacterium]
MRIPDPSSPPNKTNSVGMTIVRIAVLLFVIGITIYIYLIRDQAKDLANYGYTGIFLLSILANATIILPAPGILFVFAMGGVFNPAFVAIAAGGGAAIGELSGYLAGFSGQPVIENVALYQRIRTWMQQNRQWVGPFIMFLAFLPLPFFDLAGIASGALKIPLRSFFLWCLAGKMIKMLAIAYAGAYSFKLIP